VIDALEELSTVEVAPKAVIAKVGEGAVYVVSVDIPEAVTIVLGAMEPDQVSRLTVGLTDDEPPPPHPTRSNEPANVPITAIFFSICITNIIHVVSFERLEQKKYRARFFRKGLGWYATNL